MLSAHNPSASMRYLMHQKNFRLAFDREHAAWFYPQTLEQLIEGMELRRRKSFLWTIFAPK